MVGLIDETHNYTEPKEGPSDIADDLLPFNMDGLNYPTL